MSALQLISRKYHVLSLGAGVNSTALLHYLIDNKLPLDEVVFADTGAEKPETYAYLNNIIVPFLERKSIPFATVRNKKTLIERCLQGHNLPDKRYRWSTRDFKITPIYNHLKKKAAELSGVKIRQLSKVTERPIKTYMGICFDEPHRVKASRINWNENLYPLFENRFTRQSCVHLIKSHGWPVPMKSGCFFCPFSSELDLYWLWKNNPKQWNIAVALEKNCSKYPNFSIHGDTTLDELAKKFELEDAKVALENQRAGPQTVLLPDFSDECSGYCVT